MKVKVSYKEINRLAIPGILFNIVEPFIGMTDMAILGRLSVGATEAQAGVGLSASLFALLVWGFAQMRTAVSALVSRHYGMKKLDAITLLIPQALYLSVLIGLVVAILSSQFLDPIMHFLYGTSERSVHEYATSYYAIRIAGLPLALFTACAFGVFRGLQNTMYAMKISIAGGCANIVFDLILVNGVGDIIPAYGVEGAAVASLMSQLVMVTAGIVYLYRKTPFRLNISFYRHSLVGEMMKMFLNMFIRTMALNVAFILANRFANSYGKLELAAYAIASNIWLFTSFFIDGYSNAGNAIAGKLLGQKDPIMLRALAKQLTKINLIMATVLSIVYTMLYPVMGSFFSSDPEVILVFNSVFWIVIIAQPVNSIAFTFDGIYKGMGSTVLLRDTLLVATFAGFIPLIYLCDYLGFGFYSIWIAFVAWMLARGGSLFVIFFKKYRAVEKA